MLNLINIYDNFKKSEELFTLISILPNNFWVQGKIAGRYQFWSTTNDGKYLIVIYQSNKYNKYNIVAIKMFSDNKSIYGKISLNSDLGYNSSIKDINLYKAINPDFLDYYYDNVFICDNVEFYLNGNAYSSNISKQIGLDIATEIVTQSGDIYLDQEETDFYTGLVPLYYLSGNDLITTNLNCDNPTTFYHRQIQNFNSNTNRTEYSVVDGIYDKTFYDYAVYFDLSYIFNYNYDINSSSCNYLKNNLYIINNEWAYFDTVNVNYLTNLIFNTLDGTAVQIVSNVKKSAVDILPDNLYEVLENGKLLITDSVPNMIPHVQTYDDNFGDKYSLYNFAKSIESNIMMAQYHDKLYNYPIYEESLPNWYDGIYDFYFTLGYRSSYSVKHVRVILKSNVIKVNNTNMISYYDDLYNVDLWFGFDWYRNGSRHYIYRHSVSGIDNPIYITGGTNHVRCIDSYDTTVDINDWYKFVPIEVFDLTGVSINNTWDVCYDTLFEVITNNQKIFDDFHITSFIINETNTDSNVINNLVGRYYGDSNLLQDMNNQIRNGMLDVRPQPLPSVLSNGSYKFWNIAPLNVISYVYNNLYSINDIRNMYYNGGVSNPLTIRDNINTLVNDSTDLVTSDKNIYNTFCKKYSNLTAQINTYYYERQLILIENKYTSEKEIIDLFSNFRKYSSLYILSYSKSYTSTYKYLKYYTDSTQNAVSYFGSYLKINTTTGSNIDAYNAHWFTKVRLGRVDSLIGSIHDCNIIIDIVNFKTKEKISGIVIDNVSLSDFTHIGDYYYFDLLDYIINDLNKTDFYPVKIEFKMMYETNNVGFSYYDRVDTKYYTNFDNISYSRNFIFKVTSASTTGTEEDINEVRCNIQDKIEQTLIPQKSYSIPLSFEVFDIEENMYDFVPDDKNILMLNNYIGNNINNITVSDLTNIQDSTDIFIIDRIRTEYARYTNIVKNIPFREHKEEYCRIQIKYDIPDESEFLFDSYEVVNLYNSGLVDTNKGVVYCEGKVSDYTSNMDFDDLFKVYKVVNNFTITSNVPSTINLPVNITLTFRFYPTKNDFDNDATYTEIVYDDYLMYNIVNRGDAITPTSDWFPKLFYIIEYYEIYPQYSQQEEKEYIYDMYFTLESAIEDIKVSEVFFDVCFLTSDVYIGIPVDYSNLSDIDMAVDFNQSNNKEEILDFINFYIRHKCPNCTKMNYKIKMKIIPSYFGMNICGFTFSSYTYNVKFEQYIPYLFYKESADTILMLHKNSVIEKENVPISLSDSSNLMSLIDINTINLLGLNNDNFVTTSEMPKKSRLTLTIFNSSSNPKEVLLEMYENNSPISNLDMTTKTFNMAPFDMRQISIYQTLDTTKYDDTFNSGIVYYKLYERTKGYTDWVEIYDKLELPIPTLNEYLTKYMSILERASKLIETRYSKLKVDPPKEEKIQEGDLKSNVNIKVYDEAEKNYIQYGLQSYGNIKDYYNMAVKFVVIVDYDDVSDYVSRFTPFGSLIYIKIPYSINARYDVIGDFKNKNINSLNNDSTLNYSVNNLYDFNSDNYLYLVGQKTDVNKQEFRLDALFEFEDNSLYDNIMKYYADNLDDIKSTILSLNINVPDIQSILFSFFNVYGEQVYNYIVNNFITIDTFTDSFDDIISEFTDMVSSNSEISKEDSALQNFKLTYGYKQIESYVLKESFDVGTSNIYVDSVGAGAGWCNIRYKDKPMDIAGGSINSFEFSYFNIPSDNPKVVLYKEELKEIYKYITNDVRAVDEKITDIDKWLFDDVYNVLYNSLWYKTFSGLYLTYPSFTLDVGNLLDNLVDIKLYIDNESDRIHDVIVAKGNNIQNISSKSIIYLDANETYKFYLDVDNMKFYTLTINVNGNTFYIDNIIYPIWEVLLEKLKKQPITISRYFSEDSNLVITQTSNYTKIFEIPLVINKSLDSYVTIEKIRIVENGIYNNDYIVRFGDLNERYTRRASNNIADITINKTIDKYAPGLRFVVSAFNIPNTTGQYFTTMLIYFTFNGKKYVVPLDVSYQVVLPNSLDNEQLLYSVEKIDGVDISSFKKEQKDQMEKLRCVIKGQFMKGASGTGAELTRWFKP